MIIHNRESDDGLQRAILIIKFSSIDSDDAEEKEPLDATTWLIRTHFRYIHKELMILGFRFRPLNFACHCFFSFLIQRLSVLNFVEDDILWSK